MPMISFAESIRQVLDYSLGVNPQVIIMGEGVDDPIGIWGTTKGLAEKYGQDRVIDMPLCENAATGFAIGAALSGLIPIAVHQRIDFLLLAMDQIVNHAAKFSYMFGGRVSVPLTIRAAVGMGWGMAGQHSQNLHSLFTHIPGLKVVMPSTPYDAKGLLLSSIVDPNPVIFIENYLLYQLQGEVPSRPYFIPLGKGIIRRKGNDATVVTFSIMANRILEAAKLLAEDGIDLEVIDLRTLIPLDEDIILNSVKKTKRLILVEPAVVTGSFAAEIIARITQRMTSLRSPILRICFPDAPCPASSALERVYYPDTEKICRMIGKNIKKR